MAECLTEYFIDTPYVYSPLGCILNDQPSFHCLESDENILVNERR